MPEVQLAHGKTLLIDEVDYDLVQFKWSIEGGNKDRKRSSYLRRRTMKNRVRKQFWMHRVILGRMIGRELLATETVDHINNNGLDNRRANLRLADTSQQKANVPKQRTYAMNPTRSMYKGVVWYKDRRLWGAKIQRCGVERYLGSFISEIDAAKAYDKAAIECFGEFAKLNF
jgi:hypothetical protein